MVVEWTQAILMVPVTSVFAQGFPGRNFEMFQNGRLTLPLATAREKEIRKVSKPLS